MRRIAILVAVLSLLLLGGLGLLVSRALESVASEQAMRHSVLADRVFDELEEELTTLIDREEARPFLQYRFFYVPEGQLPGAAPALSRSPLSEVPDDDWLLGWFQVDPGGDVSTPLEPRNVELANTLGGWSADPVQTDRAVRVQAAARTLPFTPAPVPEPESTLVASRDPAPATTSERAVISTKPAPAPPPVTPTVDKTEAQPKEEVSSNDGYVALDTQLPQKKQRKKDQGLLSSSGSTYGTSISSLNKGAESRAGRQQRVTKSRADNLGSFQNPAEYNSNYLQQGDSSLPEVGFDNDPSDAVADTMDERYRANEDADEDSGLLGGLFGSRRSDVSEQAPAREAQAMEGEEAAEQERDDADGVAETESVRDELSAVASLEASGEDEDIYSPEPGRRRSLTKNGRARKTPKFKRNQAASQAASQPAAQAPEPAPAQPAPTLDAVLADAPSDEELDLASVVEGQGDLPNHVELELDANEATDVPEVVIEIPAPAAGPRLSEQKSVEEDGDERVASAEVDSWSESVQSQTEVEPVRRQVVVKEKAVQTPQVPMPAGAEEVDVEISPLQGHRADEETLLLYRTVRIGETEYVQGLALLLPALARWLEKQVLQGADVQPFLELAWNVGPSNEPGDSDFVFAHTFADPFRSLAATAYLRALPEGRRSGRTWILQLTLMLLVVAGLGLAALWRMVSVVVHFAERRSNFVAAVSHELKTPLTAIRMYSEMLRDGYVLNEEKRAEYYETMAAESERLSRLIQNVLELSKLEHSGTTTGGEPVVGAVRPVLEEAIRVLDRHARGKGFTIELDAPDDLPTVRFERDGLLQVLINLVDNAIKFSKETETKVVVVQARASETGITLKIRDHGPGVPQRQLNRIFQPFFRGERELTRRTKGTGIGLALVKGIVERMGGKVSARNHPGGGFEVAVALTGG